MGPTQWLTGSIGTQRASELADALWEKIKCNTNQTLRTTYGHFVPWMSQSEWLIKAGDLLQCHELTDILTEPTILNKLRNLYKADGKGPLSLLSDAENLGVDIFPGEDGEDGPTHQLFLKAKHRVLATSPDFRIRFEHLNRTIVPLAQVNEKGTFRTAFTSHDVKGAMFIVIPDVNDDPHWKLHLELDMVHELGHMALIVYQSADRLLSSELSLPIYSGVRKTDRPAIMSLHAAIALTYQIEYLGDLIAQRNLRRDKSIIDYAIGLKEDLRRSLKDTLNGLERCQFTPLGWEIMEEFETWIEPGESKASAQLV